MATIQSGQAPQIFAQRYLEQSKTLQDLHKSQPSILARPVIYGVVGTAVTFAALVAIREADKQLSINACNDSDFCKLTVYATIKLTEDIFCDLLTTRMMQAAAIGVGVGLLHSLSKVSSHARKSLDVATKALENFQAFHATTSRV